MPIWADRLSCNEFEPEGSYVLHSIPSARVSRGGVKVSSPPLRPGGGDLASEHRPHRTRPFFVDFFRLTGGGQ